MKRNVKIVVVIVLLVAVVVVSDTAFGRRWIEDRSDTLTPEKGHGRG
jgi:hypothetical protein